MGILSAGSLAALSFKLADRVAELGLQNFPEDGLPSEENLAVFEAAGRVAKEKGRFFVGSAEGEDLQKHFRRSWSKLPRVDVPVGDGSFPERHRQMAEFKKAKGACELDYPSYACFQSHLLDWGMKLVLMKVATPVDVLGYTLLLSKLWEEGGGARTSYHYDMHARRSMAKALEKGDDQWKRFMRKLDTELAAKASIGKGGGKASSGKGKLDGSSKGSSGAAVPGPRSLPPPVAPHAGRLGPAGRLATARRLDAVQKEVR
ncbi:unnamed protein product [Prorocentrum cordatum]|uniref:Uncharacterized protein n=1 Tax=Prorocentrum cordatum TaxID=2364126 RepID=A0ABN9ULQ5_9DINO|nr:unnamed protein product [Polarella glacialis]